MNPRSLLPGSRLVRLVLVMLIALGAAVPAVAAGRQDGDKVLTGGFDVGPGGCAECFNPLQAGAGFTWLEKYYSKLVLYNVELTDIQGELAESWEVSEDGLRYTLNLQEGVTWHDGEPFTSEDVRYTIMMAKDPDSASWIGEKFNGVTEIETPDELTAVLVLDQPNAAILDALTFIVMLPEHELSGMSPAEIATSDWWRTNPIGTGPFRWGTYEEGQYVELVAYDDYWRGRPNIDRLVNRFFPEAGSAVLALRSGEVQFTYLTADEAVELEGNEEMTVIAGPSLVANVITWNHTLEQYADPRVRQAWMYAIDEDAIVESLFAGSATNIPCIFAADQFIPDGLDDYAFDPDRARELLEDAGWEQDGPIEFFTYYGDQLSNDVMIAIQQFLADVGVDVEIRVMDVPSFTERVNTTTDWHVFYGGAGNGPDPDITRAYFDSNAFPPNGVNRARYESAEMDELYATGRSEADPDARAEAYQDACALQNEEVPWGFLWVSDRFGAVTTDVENFVWTPAPGGGRYYDAAHEWDIPEN
jgi:peptide/nickel transport system substrate-binding protein